MTHKPMRFTIQFIVLLTLIASTVLHGCRSRATDEAASNAPYITGELEFSRDDNRQPARTWDVGKRGKRRYIQGGSTCQAVWSFGKLHQDTPPRIAFTFDVFRSWHGMATSPGVLCSLAFRNPQNGYRTESVFLTIESEQPRLIDTLDGLSDVMGGKVSLPLLLESGKLEVIFKCHQPGQFVGIRQGDLIVVHPDTDVAVALGESAKTGTSSKDGDAPGDIDDSSSFLAAAGNQNASLTAMEILTKGMLKYAAHNGHLPPLFSANANGSPLLSWRVHILPFIGQQALYDRFHLDEPWDSPHNVELVSQMPAVFTSPEFTNKPGQTPFLAIAGPGTMFDGIYGRPLSDATDGPQHTVLLTMGDPDHTSIWTSPGNLVCNLQAPKTGMATFNDQLRISFLDGHTEALQTTISDEILASLLLRSDMSSAKPRQ